MKNPFFDERIYEIAREFQDRLVTFDAESMLDSLDTIPVATDGTLPVTLFSRKLNFRRIKEKGIKWLLCCAANDDLLDSASAHAPMDYIDTIELAIFPKGHGAIATSWSNPETEYAIQKRFGSYRGPVRFQLDLEEEFKTKKK